MSAAGKGRMSDERADNGAAETARPAPPVGGSWFPCPYCGERQSVGSTQCGACGGLFEPLSRQATQNQMGPWFVRDPSAPFVPGRSYQTIRRMAQRGKITLETVVRGPTTRQFWMAASEAQGVAHLLGRCHACKAPARADDFSCESCGAAFTAPEDRQQLGLAPVRLLPGQAPPALVAERAMGAGSGTAFSALAGASGGGAASPRPSSPAPLAPAMSAPASSVVVGPGVPAPASAPGSGRAPARADEPGDGGAESASLRRGLRIASRRVAALRNLVIALAIVNVIVLAALLATAFGGGGEAGSPAAERDAAGAPSGAAGSDATPRDAR